MLSVPVAANKTESFHGLPSFQFP